MAHGHTPYSVVFNDIINSANGPWIQMFNDAVFTGNVDEAIATGQQAMQSIIDSAPNKSPCPLSCCTSGRGRWGRGGAVGARAGPDCSTWRRRWRW